MTCKTEYTKKYKSLLSRWHPANHASRRLVGSLAGLSIPESPKKMRAWRLDPSRTFIKGRISSFPNIPNRSYYRSYTLAKAHWMWMVHTRTHTHTQTHNVALGPKQKETNTGVLEVKTMSTLKNLKRRVNTCVPQPPWPHTVKGTLLYFLRAIEGAIRL
jgi:hypothetical protein